MVRKDIIDSESSDDEQSSKSSDEDEEETTTINKKRKSSRSSENSDEDSDNQRRRTKKPRRVTHSLSESEDNDEKTSGREKNAMASTSTAHQQQQREEEKSDIEEGQLSNSDESDEDSDSSSSSSNSEFDDGYGEDLMGDQEDRNYLEKLSEKERETELFKRAERRDQLKRRWEIERKLKQSKKIEKEKKKDKKPKTKKPKSSNATAAAASKKPQKRAPSVPREDHSLGISMGTAAAATSSTVQSDEMSPNDYSKDDYFDPKERSKERKKNVEMNKTDDKRSNAMAQLKARREGKQKRDIERSEALKQQEDEKEELDGVAEKPNSTKLNPRDIYSDDSDSDSEGEKQSPSRRSSSSRSSTSDSEGSDTQATVYKKPVHISTLEQINQLRISRFKLEKFINLPIFDKTVIGCFVRINIGNNANHKIVYRVAEIVGVVETGKVYNFASGRTNKGLRLKHGSQERVFRLEFVSNQDFTQTEFDKWREICGLNDVDLPTLDTIEQKKKDIQAALNYEFKDEDIDRIIEEKNRFRSHPTNYAMKKTQLMKDRDAAINQGNEELANEINMQIQELEERANALDKKRTSSIQLISYINDRNRRKNVEEAERAILEEARANKGLKISDPFTRRSTKPTMTFKQKAGEEKVEEVMVMPEPPRANKQKDKKIGEHTSGENLYSLHDFEIELDLPALPININSAPVLPKPVEKTQDQAPKLRRSLNLEDYKKKRGLI